MLKVIDLFSGCGGLSIGFIKNSCQVIKAVEFDPSIAETYCLNHPNVEMFVDDIKNIDTTGVFKKGDADIIIGGPPCQGFSMAGSRIRDGFIDDPRNYLFKHYFNVVKEICPKVFIMENVKGILTMHNGELFNEIKRIFSDPTMFSGKPYKITHKIIRASDYGIPQKRERVILIGSIYPDTDFEDAWGKAVIKVKKSYPHFFDQVTIYDAIGNLPEVTATGVIPNPKPLTEYQKYLSCTSSTITNHIKTNHSIKAIERMRKIKNGENFTSLNEQINSVHSGAYGRLKWDEQAPTITTRFDTPAGGRFIHPVEDRTLTPREAARIQSFPDDFIFQGTKTSICRQIGNAVPPKLSFFLSNVVEVIINEHQ